MTRDGRRGRGDDGAYLVLYALLAIVLFTMAAIVLDLAALRQGRRADRSAADLAAAAGATTIDPADPTSYAAACSTAWDYLVLNREGGGGAPSAPPCAATFPTLLACDPASPAPATAVGTIGSELTVSITYPVPDSDVLMYAEVQGGDTPQVVDAAADGDACQRLAVRVQRTRSFLFGGLAGTPSGGTDVHAVARVSIASTTETPGVVALEPTGCDGVRVLAAGAPLTVAGVGAGGLVLVDSAASACAAPGFAINVEAPGSLLAESFGVSPGRIQSTAINVGNIARAYDPAAVASGRLTPAPAARPAIGRSFIDSRYLAAVTLLRASVGVSAGTPPPPYLGVPFSVYEEPAMPCTVSVPVVVPVGNWYVNCPSLIVDAPITFLGGTIVMAGHLEVSNTGCLAVNDGGCGTPAVAQDNILFFRGGDFRKPEAGQLFLNQTFVHLRGDAGATTGVMVLGADFAGGLSVITWSPPAGSSFEDLSLWAESRGAMAIGGQGTMLTSGTFFAPNSRLRMEARPGGSVLGGQYVVGRLWADGSQPLRIVTDPALATAVPVRSARLVR